MADSKSGSDGKSTGTLVGGVGGTLTGTSAIDTVTYNMPFSTVSISHSEAGKSDSGDSWTVGYSSGSGGKTGGTSGSDTLVDIERMSFSDGTHVALDVLQWEDSAGAALALCYAGFGGMPDAETLGHWIYEADNASTSSKSGSSEPQARIEHVAQSILDYYVPGGIDNGSLVQILFSNVVGRAPDPAEQSIFTNALDQGQFTPASLFALAAETDMNTGHYIDLVGSGVVYTPYSSSKTG
ncbi:MAG: hypothetical protein PHH11_12680 [Methylomonas sp.]|nr:hypothetical protein [Methylomonas sp.]